MQLLRYQCFISDLNKSSNYKFSYLPSGALRSWAARYCISAVILVLRFGKRATSQLRSFRFTDSFCKKVFCYGSTKTVEIFVGLNHQYLNIFTRIAVSLLFDSMSSNVEISSFSNALNPLSLIMFM